MVNSWAQNETELSSMRRLASRAGFASAHSAVVRAIASPWTWIVAFVLFAWIALIAPLRLPLGGYYWDVALYPDAAWRIANGQKPHVDFFAPAGALEYYSYALLHWLFPNGHMLLLSNWCILFVALPVLAAIVRQIDPADIVLRLGVVLPFLMFLALPLNTTEVYPLAGFDGFGIYNRHVSQLIYLLVAAILFIPTGCTQTLVLAILLPALFFTKITGLFIGLALIGHAFAAGSIRFKNLIGALAIAALLILTIDLTTGIVSAYLSDIAILLQINKSSLISRLRVPLTVHMDIILPSLLLAGLLIFYKRDTFKALFADRHADTLHVRAVAVLKLHGAWLLSLLAVALVFESQNSGSQEFIFLWPLFLLIARTWMVRSGPLRFAVLALIVVATLPTANAYLHRAIRTAAVALAYRPLALPQVGALGRVTGKPELVERALAMNAHYAATKPAYERLAALDLDSSHLLYSEIDFHLAWLISVEQAVKAIGMFEKNHHIHIKSLMTLDFVDPVTFSLQRQPVRLVSIGMMAGRTIPPLDARRLAAAREADAVLAPRCPVTPTRTYLLSYFAPALEGREKVTLTPCWDMYLKKKPSGAP